MENKKYNLNKFEVDLQKMEITLSDRQKEQFIKYYELLIQWNAKMNLTAITEYDEVFQKHFVDSLTLHRLDFYQEWKEASIIDVGTGAGFPGIPLKIICPHFHVTLLDSLKKRVFFLDQVIRELGLTEIVAIHDRAEDAAQSEEMREKFDLCVSRAVAHLSTLSEYCIPFVKKGGYFVSYKADISETEINDAKASIVILGGNLVEESTFTLPSSSIKRNLLVIKKESLTPNQYPRRAGIPLKRPMKGS